MMRLIGAALVVVGLLATAYGIGNAVGQAGALSDDAVARGIVGGERVSFESREPKLTVYLDTDGVANSEVKDRLAAGTGCVVSAEGFKDSFRGNVQGASATLGDYVSVGSFTLPGSSGRIVCSGDASSMPYLVSPVGAGAVFKAVGLILAGVFGGAGGVVLVVAGYRRRRRSARAQNVGAEQVHESGNW